jgi:hypothetical protein
VSRFTRPAFTAPKVPKPPKALATILPIIARVTALLPVVMAIRSVGIQSFLINGALAQAKSRIPELKQRLLKSKIVAKIQPPAIPPALNVNPLEYLEYAREMQALAANPRAALEGKVRSKVDEFGNAAKQNVRDSLQA